MVDFENKNIFWHTSAHVLAYAVKNLFPDVKFGIGPAIENGFYYDFDNIQIQESDIERIEKEAKRIIKMKLIPEKYVISRESALNMFSGQPFKNELIKDLKGEISYYKIGDFCDLCRGPHLENISEIKSIKILSIAGAYWKGNSNNKMMTRIYAVSFPEENMMKDYLDFLEEAKKRDHRLIGKQLDLFSFHPEAPGAVFWHENGWILRNEIINKWRKFHYENDYKEINTPILLDSELWKTSGHWDLYRENMYITSVENKEFAVKPMNCPGSILYYKEKARSYRDFPLKFAELGLVHRFELSGTLHGLMRVRQFTQDDAHIFIKEEMLLSEIKKIIIMSVDLLKQFGFKDFIFTVSVRNEEKKEKYLGSEEIWSKATSTLEKALGELSYDYRVSPGDAKFYGPSVDIIIKDNLGREWQCSTLQLDFNLPERFSLEYTDSDGTKKVPIMLHRTLLGSLERFIGIFIENCNGVFPFDLSPVQVVILPISEKQKDFSEKINSILRNKNIRSEISKSEETFSKRLRNTIIRKIPYIVIIGDKEVAENKISVRKYGENESKSYETEDFIKIIL
ncbi:MAG TPA: threonine--tRNA ligase [Tepiditoga sp.]|nr:threonine--tRNA ligase [Tepiditoga sp.]